MTKNNVKILKKQVRRRSTLGLNGKTVTYGGCIYVDTDLIGKTVYVHIKE